MTLVLTKTQTRYLLNTSLEQYHYTDLNSVIWHVHTNALEEPVASVNSDVGDSTFL